MRPQLVSELAAEIMGPRNGIRETLNTDPRSEYVAGLLSPRNVLSERDPDTDADMIGEMQGYEEDTSDVDETAYDLAQPILDPKALPHSMGLSFVCSAKLLSFKACVTWARYLPSEKGEWGRNPRAWISDRIIIDTEGSQRYYLTEAGETCENSSGSEISLSVVSRRTKRGLWHISAYIVNEVRSDRRPKTEEHIFQPQLRIRTLDDTKIEPEESLSIDPIERELDFTYRNRPVMARGHLCSAVWEKVDPERPSLNPDAESKRPLTPPFFWLDGALVAEKYDTVTKDLFSKPHVRTEFFPLFLVEAPDLSWNEKWGKEPELSAETLSETYDPSQLRSRLLPLVYAYKEWIFSMEKTLRKTSEEDDASVRSILSRCREVLRRIQRGIDLLVSDEDARLAFCFGNKALDLQYRWSSGDGLRWYPFQLAYVLMALESCVRLNSDDRGVCDLLWVPTGSGKTEAYLLLAAVVLGYRRRIASSRNSGDRTGGGVSVISRYTLRLLTIQQFRRTLKMITACEYLRVHGLASARPVGWRPHGCQNQEDFLWGSTSFSIGLWVGGAVRPNRLRNTYIPETNTEIPGALSILRGEAGDGEPAQVLNCPVCDSIIAIPEKGLEAERPRLIHLVVATDAPHQEIEKIVAVTAQTERNFKINCRNVRPLSRAAKVMTIEVSSQSQILAEDIDSFWSRFLDQSKKNDVTLELIPARASRPGYFIHSYQTSRGSSNHLDFSIYCPNPDCQLNSNVIWFEGVPFDCGWIYEGHTGKSLRSLGKTPQDLQCDHLEFKGRKLALSDGMHFRTVAEWCRSPQDGFSSRWLAKCMPIPALTVDEQIYTHPPSFLISTVDKFARLPFEPRCGCLFGNIQFYDARYGYYRTGLPAFAAGYVDHPRGIGAGTSLHCEVPPFKSPDLIIQDELHLIEGPLGSLTGLYEVAFEWLISRDHNVKYVASTATVRRADEQVKSVFSRELLYFPPAGSSHEDRFFLRFNPDPHPIDDQRAGQMYAGICAFGKGPLTPLIRVWARLMQSAHERASSAAGEVDPFWTIVGYFNAVRELAGARNLYRQDIPERISRIGGSNARPLDDENVVELSSRAKSTELPSILNSLEDNWPKARDALFTTSMFGTGVDIRRLSLMVVNGQPKTSSSYIQATGRVGRTRGGFVATLYRATRPRDLSHYEFFCGYHGALHRFVEDITVSPFSEGTLHRALGPVTVALLRNARGATVPWQKDESAGAMASSRSVQEVLEIPSLFEKRGQGQPSSRLPQKEAVRVLANSKVDDWKLTAMRHNDLKYVEYGTPKSPVVLGDPRHDHTGIPVVYRNAPQSLREVEETTGFQV